MRTSAPRSAPSVKPTPPPASPGSRRFFKDKAQKLEETKAVAELANKKAEMADLGELLKQKLDAVITEKNSVERMLEEMAKKRTPPSSQPSARLSRRPNTSTRTTRCSIR